MFPNHALPPVLRAAGLAAVLIAGTSAGLAATYHVAPAGDDTNNTGLSAASPWRTIARANAVVQPGDTVLLHGGEYESLAASPENTIAPAVSGTAENPITYRAHEGGTPVLTNIVSKQPALALANRAHIVIEGITVDGKALGAASNIKAWGLLDHSSHITIRNCFFKYAYAYSGILIESSTQCRLLNNRFDFCGDWNDGSRGDWGDSVEFRNSTNSLVEGNDFKHGGHNSLAVGYSSKFNVVRHNTFDGDWSDVYPRRSTGTVGNRTVVVGDNEPGAAYNLFERNVVKNTGSAVDKNYPTALKIQGVGQICRFNYIYNNVHEAIRSDTLGESPATVGNRIYHNAIFNNGGPAWYGRRVSDGVLENRLIDDNIFKNNVVHRSLQAPDPANPNYSAQVFMVPYPADVDDPMRANAVIANSFVRHVPGDAVLYLHHDFTGASPQTLTQLESTPPYNADVSGNLSVWPDFVADHPAAPEDFRLKPTSALIDAGAALTHAANDGTDSTTLIVLDAGYFCDGYEVVAGDFVQIGTQAAVQLLDVDYSTRTLTLASPRSWAAGAPVSLPFEGAAPDIGAWEFTSGPAPVAPVITVASATTPTSVQLTWTDSYEAEVAFLLERRTGDEGAFQRIATLGPNQTTYLDSPLTSGVNYHYRLAVTTQSAVSAWSSMATVTTPLPPPEPPVIVSLSDHLTVPEGSPAALQVVFTGTPVPDVQWLKNGVPVSGATTAALSISAASPADSGVYTAFLSNPSGTALSNPLVLAVNPKGSAGKIPLTAIASSFETGRNPELALDGQFSTAWQARDPDTPQNGEWIRFDMGSEQRVDLIKIAWETAAARTFTYDVQVSSDGVAWTNLRSKVKNAGTGALETDDLPDTLCRYIRIWGYGSQVAPRVTTIRELEAWAVPQLAPPAILQMSVPAEIGTGESASLAVVATGSPAPALQWHKDGVALPGATGPVLTIINATVADSGNYHVAAENDAGIAVSAALQMSIVDRVPPVLHLPPDLTLEATGPGGATAVFSATAEDAQDGPVQVTFNPASGSVFPLGLTVVTAAAADASGNTATGSFRVLVQDTTPPALTLPDNIVIEANQAGGAFVHFAPGATDLATPRPALQSVPASGSLFPHGETWVLVTATDGAGNAQSRVFSVTVNRSAVSRRAPTLNGQSIIAGSLQVLEPESVTLNGQVTILRDLLVPGLPAVRRNGAGGNLAVAQGAGDGTPTTHRITLNGQSALRSVVRRTDGFTLTPVAAPVAPTGTRNVSLNQAGQSPGDFATLRNLTLNGNAGEVAVPPGAYGAFTANGSSRFVFGLAGNTEPARYDLQGLTLNGQSRLVIAGPVILTLAGSTSFSAPAGNPAHSDWLVLRLAAGNLTLNSGADLSALVEAPAGTVTINGNTGLIGGVVADRLVLNGDATLELTNPPSEPLP